MPDPASPRPPIRDAGGRFALTAEQVAARLATREGRAELSASLGHGRPVDLARLGDPAYLATLEPAEIADHWDQIEAASEAAKGAR